MAKKPTRREIAMLPVVLGAVAAGRAEAQQPGIAVDNASLADVQQALAQGRISPSALTKAYLARIEAYDRGGPALNSVRELNPDALASRGIGIDEVQAAIARNNVNLPTGTLWGRKQAFTVHSNGQLFNAAAYRPLIVAYRNGNPVRLAEVANIIDSVENDKNRGWYKDSESVRERL